MIKGSQMVQADNAIQSGIFMKDSLEMGFKKGLEGKYIVQAIIIQVILRMEKGMDLENLCQRMVKQMKGNFRIINLFHDFLHN